jgi:hypothetical protein
MKRNGLTGRVHHRNRRTRQCVGPERHPTSRRGPRGVTRRLTQDRLDTKLRPQAVQSGNDVSPTPGVESSLRWVPSESVMKRPGAENTM